jgi:DUF2934 family protein
MDDYVERLHLRAYLIWEREGRPEGRELDHWRAAEEELAREEVDGAGLQAGRDYDKGVKEFEKSGRVAEAAEKARKALDSPERDELERAQETARRKGRGDDRAAER